MMKVDVTASVLNRVSLRKFRLTHGYSTDAVAEALATVGLTSDANAVPIEPRAHGLSVSAMPHYSTTSSAMATRPDGTSRPSAFAVLRLIASS
jgi:hypothetical protein